MNVQDELVGVNNEIAETKIKISKYEEAIEIAKIKSDMEELKELNARLDKLEDRLDKWISVYDGLLKKENLLFGQAKENNELLGKILEDNQKIMQCLRREKDGKSLTTADLNSFTYVTSFVPSKLYQETITHFLFHSIKEIVQEFTLQMQEHDKLKSYDELKFVQPNSYELIVKLVSLYSNQFRIYRKSSDHSKLSYSTILTDPVTGETVSVVRGETDEVVYYNNVCLLLIEDQSLCKGLTETAALAQTLAELKGFAERYKSAVLKEPKKFWGILRTGKKWSFVLRIFKEGKTGMFLYQLDDLFDENEIFEPQLNQVCILLLWCLENMTELAADIDSCDPISSFKSLNIHETGNGGDGKDGGRGDDKNGNRKDGRGSGKGRGGRGLGPRDSSNKKNNNGGRGKQAGSDSSYIAKLSAENLAFKENYENSLKWL